MAGPLRTPEQYREAAAKGHATAARNRATKRALPYRLGALEQDIVEAEAKLEALRQETVLVKTSMALTGKTLLREQELVAGAQGWVPETGIYFLIREGRVTYVGQSVNIHARVTQHVTGKKFDAYAYVLCEYASLDVLESLYIHMLQPADNGRHTNPSRRVNAPLRLDQILARLT